MPPMNDERRKLQKELAEHLREKDRAALGLRRESSDATWCT